MSVEDLRLYGLNAFSLIVSFTEIEMILKIFLLLISIGYTIHKWYEVYNRKK